MVRRIDFNDWQRVRSSIETTQTRILAREERPEPERLSARPAGRPAEGRPLHSHKPRSDEEWRAVGDWVRALLAERESSGRWTWVGPRRVIVAPSDACGVLQDEPCTWEDRSKPGKL
jgi:hypothetical protein